jgi:hypothetical protein
MDNSAFLALVKIKDRSVLVPAASLPPPCPN